MTIRDIKKQQEAAHTALFNEVRLFWAFNGEKDVRYGTIDEAIQSLNIFNLTH